MSAIINKLTDKPIRDRYGEPLHIGDVVCVQSYTECYAGFIKKDTGHSIIISVDSGMRYSHHSKPSNAGKKIYWRRVVQYDYVKEKVIKVKIKMYE